MLRHSTYLTLLLTLLLTSQATGQITEREATPPIILDSIRIEPNKLFVRPQQFPIVQPIMELLHSPTTPETIRGLIPFSYGDTILFQDVGDLERYLRSLRIFGDVEVVTIPYPGEPTGRDSIPFGILAVRTRDTWTIRGAASYSISRDQTTIAASVEESNFLGSARKVSLFGDYTTVADRGLRLGVGFEDPNVLGRQVVVGGSAMMGKEDRIFTFRSSRGFITDRTLTAFSTNGLYQNIDETHWEQRGDRFEAVTTPLERIGASGYVARSNGSRGDAFRVGGSVSFDRTVRDSLPTFRRALENTAGVFLGLNSTRRSYRRVLYADMGGERLVQVGGAGWISVGKVIPHSGSPDNMVAIASGAEQMGFIGPLYLNGMIEVGTGIARQEFHYTGIHVGGTAGWLLAPGAIALRGDFATVWNWPAYALKPLNSANGLRGYPIDALYGDNRAFFSLELRAHPLVDFWIFELGLVGFGDIGSVWNQGVPFSKTRWHSSAGLGLRVGMRNGGRGEKSFFRLDAAFNMDTRRVEFLIGSSESFDLFGTLDYNPPGMVLP